MRRTQTVRIVILFVLLCLVDQLPAAEPVGTAFTYQGRLEQEGSPVSDTCSFQFSLWTDATETDPGAQIGSTISQSMDVVDGLFAVQLDFGASVFTGDALWLEIAVCCSPSDCSMPPTDYTVLVPRQELTPAPYSVHATTAGSVPWSGLSGVPAGFADNIDNDLFATASCATSGHILKWSGSTWICTEDNVGPSPSVIYTRWGGSNCFNGAQLVYSGLIGGNLHLNPGGGANSLCLSNEPTWDEFNDGNQDGNTMYGTEYETAGFGIASFVGMNDFEASCAVCLRPDASNVLMVPGTQVCPDGWNSEYTGYLMSTHYTQTRSETICVDRLASGIGSSFDSNGNLLYPTEAECGSLPCPPYVQNRELTCCVCSRP